MTHLNAANVITFFPAVAIEEQTNDTGIKLLQSQTVEDISGSFWERVTQRTEIVFSITICEVLTWLRCGCFPVAITITEFHCILSDSGR